MDLLAGRVPVVSLEIRVLQDPLVPPEIQGNPEAMAPQDLQVAQVVPEILDHQVR